MSHSTRFTTRFSLLALAIGLTFCATSPGDEAAAPGSSTPDLEIPAGHALAPVMQYAERALKEIEQIQDYSCILVKRERVDGKLFPYQYMTAKIRHERESDGATTPFGVYLQFRAPASVRGREVLYIAGQNGGQMLARRGGNRLGSVTTWLRPDSRLAMQDNRYPITEIGLSNLIRKLIEVAREDLKYQECEVQYFRDAKVNDRICTHIRVIHPHKRAHFRFHQADIYVDNELRLPIRFASYDWPPRAGGSPRLLEEYNYVKLKLNVGLDDADFDRNNPQYGFRKDEDEEGSPGK